MLPAYRASRFSAWVGALNLLIKGLISAYAGVSPFKLEAIETI